MASPTFLQIQVVFDQALEHPTAERSRFLRDIDIQDPAIAQQVRALLRIDGQLPDDATSKINLMSILDADLCGQRVGAYELAELVGQGGMGRVYRARRVDGEVEQQVAIKVIRGLWLNEQAQSRFHMECQVLAHLKHPNIAHMIDAGALDDRVPYLVMEYVQGVPITDYCESKQLGVSERLQLFRQAAEAVAHAHRNLIVHRDLKPRNILVTEEGQVKLLDFGIAKPLTARLGGIDVYETGTLARAFSPAYAAPEQVAGEAVSVSIDIYALGVVLYQLLSGQLPLQVYGRSSAEIERDICEKLPRPPSRASGSPAVAKNLRGDLDSIVLKCLAKAPDERYGTVGEFLDDIQRYFDRLPIRARKRHFVYRCSKYLQRNRFTFVASSVVLGIVVISSGLTVEKYHEALRERDQAKLVTQLMISVLQPTTATGSRVDNMALMEATQLSDAGIKNPQVIASLLVAFATAQMFRGWYERATKTLDSATALFHVSNSGSFAIEIKYLRAILALKSNDYGTAQQIVSSALGMSLSSLQELRFNTIQVELDIQIDDFDSAMKRVLRLRHEVENLDILSTEEAHKIERLYGEVLGELRQVRNSLSVYMRLAHRQVSDLHRGHPSLIETISGLALANFRCGNVELAKEQALDSMYMAESYYGLRSPQMLDAMKIYAQAVGSDIGAGIEAMTIPRHTALEQIVKKDVTISMNVHREISVTKTPPGGYIIPKDLASTLKDRSEF